MSNFFSKLPPIIMLNILFTTNKGNHSRTTPHKINWLKVILLTLLFSLNPSQASIKAGSQARTFLERMTAAFSHSKIDPSRKIILKEDIAPLDTNSLRVYGKNEVKTTYDIYKPEKLGFVKKDFTPLANQLHFIDCKDAHSPEESTTNIIDAWNKTVGPEIIMNKIEESQFITDITDGWVVITKPNKAKNKTGTLDTNKINELTERLNIDNSYVNINPRNREKHKLNKRGIINEPSTPTWYNAEELEVEGDNFININLSYSPNTLSKVERNEKIAADIKAYKKLPEDIRKTQKPWKGFASYDAIIKYDPDVITTYIKTLKKNDDQNKPSRRQGGFATFMKNKENDNLDNLSTSGNGDTSIRDVSKVLDKATVTKKNNTRRDALRKSLQDQ